MPVTGRRERERLRHRREILLAAEKIFTEKGFFPTTVQEIARAAEFSVGALYQHFASKEELYSCLILERARQMTEKTLSATVTEPDPVSKIRALIREQLKICEENKQFFRLLAGEIESPSSEVGNRLKMEILAIYQSYFDSVEKIISQGLRRKVFRNFNAKKLTIALLGMIHGFTSHWYQSGFQENLSENSDLILTIFLENITRQTPASPEPSSPGKKRGSP